MVRTPDVLPNSASNTFRRAASLSLPAAALVFLISAPEPASANGYSANFSHNPMAFAHSSNHSAANIPLPTAVQQHHHREPIHTQQVGGQQGEYGGPNPGGRRLALDLTSTNQNIMLGSALFNNTNTTAVTISIGGTSQTFSTGMKVTAAEYVAITQKLGGGDQTLTLSDGGAATGGTFTANGIVTRCDSQLVVPTGVTMVDNFASGQVVGLRGDIFNFGSIYGVSNSQSTQAGTISAKDIFNELGGTISTNLPHSLSGFADNASQLALNLKADNSISNYGTISSSGNLSMTTGSGDISNSALGVYLGLSVPGGATLMNVPSGTPNFIIAGGSPALISASGNININAGGSVYNTATISSSHGQDVSITALNSISNQGSILSGGKLNLVATTGDITNNQRLFLPLTTANPDIPVGLSTNGIASVLRSDGVMTISAGGDFTNNGNIETEKGSISVTAANNFTNFGTITSAGDLNLTATTGSVENTGSSAVPPPGPSPMFIPAWSGPPPVIVAAGDVNISSGNGYVLNNGSITANKGSINISAPSDSTNIQVSAMWGSFTASDGNINVRNQLYSGSADINMNFGSYSAQNLNLYSGTGTISGGVQGVTGNVNTVGSTVNFFTNVPMPL